MWDLFQDVLGIFTSFSLVDYVLYIAVVTLIILIVSLIYVIHNEKEEANEDIENKESEGVLDMKPKANEIDDEIDLQNIVNTIDENPKPLADMTLYEEEQEKRAIISYDELIKEAKAKSLYYDQEELVDDVIPVKRIQTTPKEETPLVLPELKLEKKEPEFTVDVMENTSKLFTYEKEEAFLKALKELEKLLN